MFRLGIPLLLVVLFGAFSSRAAGEAARPNAPVTITPTSQPATADQDALTGLARRLAAEQPPTAPASPPAETDIDSALATREDQPIPLQRGDSDRKPAASAPSPISSGAFQTIASLAAIIGLILLLRYGISRVTGRAVAATRSSVVEVLGRVSIAPRSHVLLVRLGRRVIAVGETPAGLRTLAQIDDGEEVAEILQAVTADKPTSVSRGFNQLMRRFNSEYPESRPPGEEGADEQEYSIDRARDQVSSLMSRLRGVGAGRKPV